MTIEAALVTEAARHNTPGLPTPEQETAFVARLRHLAADVGIDDATASFLVGPAVVAWVTSKGDVTFAARCMGDAADKIAFTASGRAKVDIFRAALLGSVDVGA
jgi:hypothetical protein